MQYLKLRSGLMRVEDKKSFRKQPSKEERITSGERIDMDRLNYYRMLEAAKKEQPQGEQKLKQPININIFREDMRRQQRDFHQQNHQFLKMSSVMTTSASNPKFNDMEETSKKQTNFSKGNTNNKNVFKRLPTVHVGLDNVEFNCALISQKIQIKDIYLIFPFRWESIIFQSHNCLSADFIFFLFENKEDVAENLKVKLDAIEEEGMVEFKSKISQAFKNVNFFDYLYFVNTKFKQNKDGKLQREKQEKSKSLPVSPKKQGDVIYPKYIDEIAASNASYLSKIDQDQQEKSLYNHNEIFITEIETCERMIVCQETDMMDDGENLCFDSLKEYSEYKYYKAIDFKYQKIFQKDAIINTNIRNIISTEKIYLVEIIQEVKSYIRLSQECDGTTIMGKVYLHLINKADQYLRLLCGYTESKILTTFNIQNYQEKIYTFIEKSIRYKKELKKIDPYLLKQFPVLEIWFKLPQNLLGYSREELHNTFYDLMQAIIVFQQKIKAKQLYDNLKTKRPGVKYILN